MKTFCRYFNEGACKSCDLISFDYSRQIHFKEEELTRALGDLDHKLLPTVTKESTHFRNKAKLVVTGTLDNPIIGLWGEENLDQGRELLHCPLHLDEINQMLPLIKSFIKEALLPPYEIAQRKGELKGVVIFYSETSKESYLRFILRSKESIDRIRKKATFLFDHIPSLTCLSVNLQPVPHALLEGKEEIFISERKTIKHELQGIHFHLGPEAFVQTNQKVAVELYQTAARWVEELKVSSFLELFCGQGAFSFFAAPHVSRSLGIEINPEAIKNAERTAKELKFSHLRFKSADAGDVKKEIEDFSPEVLLVNPPRRGLGEALPLVLHSGVKELIYSSCSIDSLKKDLSELQAKYEIKKIKIFDMFPQTRHFETLVHLSYSGR
jgi:23S rRNA (uracil747-C5)-methyltransferase